MENFSNNYADILIVDTGLTKKGKTESHRFKWPYSKAITMILEFLLLSSVGLLVGAGRN